MKRVSALIRTLPADTRRRLLFLTAVGALGTTAVLIVVTVAARHVASGQSNILLLVTLMIAILAYTVSQSSLMKATAKEVGQSIGRQRSRLFEHIRKADLDMLNATGRQPLYAALTRDVQTISYHLPMMIIGMQQLVLLVFVSLYLMVLSVALFLIAAAFSVLAIAVHVARMKALATMRREADVQDRALFDGLREMLDGFKELKLSNARTEALADELVSHSAAVRQSRATIQQRIGFEVTLVQVLFYCLVGIMVFVLPLMVANYGPLAVPATTATLFLIGPIGAIAQVLPTIEDVETALARIQSLEDRLHSESERRNDEAATPLASTPHTVDLEEVTYRYTEPDGAPGFAVGPVTARFRAGEITFITGGNGAGKSTVLRLMTALVAPSGGVIRINGEPLEPTQRQAYRDEISAVFADFHLFRTLYGLDEPATEQVEAMLQRFELQGKVAIPNGAFSTIQLSTGQRKRLALMLVEFENKPIIILDEWAADQDPRFRRLFYREILPSLRDQGKMVICVTHDDNYFDVADRVLHLDEGRFTQQRRPH